MVSDLCQFLNLSGFATWLGKGQGMVLHELLARVCARSICTSSGHAHSPLMQMEGARPLFTLVGMHILSCHFHSPIPNDSRIGSGPKVGDPCPRDYTRTMVCHYSNAKESKIHPTPSHSPIPIPILNDSFHLFLALGKIIFIILV